jgi:hypothetical protein
MAITNAQQYQQLVNKSADGKRPGYAGRQDAESQYGGGSYDSSANQSGREQSFGGNTNRERAITQQYKGPKGTTGDIRGSGADPKPPTEIIKGKEFPVNPRTSEEQEKKNFAISLENDRRRVEARKQKLKEIAFLDNLGMLGYTRRTKDANLEELGMIDPQTMRIAGYEMPNILSGITSAITVDPSTDYFDIDSIREIGGVLSKSPTAITKTQANTLGDLRQDIQMEDRINNPDDRVTQSEFEEYMNRNKVILPEGGGGDQPILTPYQEDVVEDEVDPNSLAGMLANRGLAYRFMADGGRAGFMGGGMPYEGGMMDLESARQMYGLGKLVKKATGAIKKIVKSPVGKAALLYGLGSYGLGKGLFGGIKGAGFLKGPAMKDFLFGGKDFALKNLTSKGVLAGIGGISALSGLMSQPEEDEEETYYRGPSLDINAIRNNPYGTKGPAFGFYAEGGNVKEPVAKDTMRLLDMNGMEKDYRADGGFVPIGRMERADDVPARLSKNEFVFTADAVRNAGDGDIDKGAEVMYNMMKNLEAGGDISEESQGLNGAREMFQTSKRLEEVL